MSTSTRQTSDGSTSNQPSAAAVERPVSDVKKNTKHPGNLPEGRPQTGQVVFLNPGCKISINKIAQQMMRPAEHIEALKISIAEVGQLNPCVLVQLSDGGYQLLAGVTRKTACDQLKVQCNCIVMAKMTDEEANEWVAREREANRNQRHLNSAQKAVDGARLCVDVFEPAAQNRMKLGKAASGESGESTELAAKACGITASSVKTAKKNPGDASRSVDSRRVTENSLNRQENRRASTGKTGSSSESVP